MFKVGRKVDRVREKRQSLQKLKLKNLGLRIERIDSLGDKNTFYPFLWLYFIGSCRNTSRYQEGGECRCMTLFAGGNSFSSWTCLAHVTCKIKSGYERCSLRPHHRLRFFAEISESTKNNPISKLEVQFSVGKKKRKTEIIAKTRVNSNLKNLVAGSYKQQISIFPF